VVGLFGLSFRMAMAARDQSPEPLRTPGGNRGYRGEGVVTREPTASGPAQDPSTEVVVAHDTQLREVNFR
jgi:hypothetical protein